MTAGLLPPDAAKLLTPESVTPALLFLVGEDAPSRVIMGAGAGVYAVTHIEETPGVFPARIRAHAGDDRRAVLEIAVRATAFRSKTHSPRRSNSLPPPQGRGRRPCPIGVSHA